MAAIHSIKIKNFKAFLSEETILLDGKNLLMYGENGSGKSSIYFALYTLLQSSIKGKDTDKYFKRDSNENLLNVYSDNDESYIQISLKDEPSKFYELSLGGLKPNGDTSKIEELNLSSDFVSHRLLINFYNFRNSNQINLFPVFYRDILPYYQTQDKKHYLNDLLEDIRNGLPYGREKVLPVEDEQIEYFNKELELLVNKINTEATEFYNKYFKPQNSPELQIKLYYQADNDPNRDEGDNNLYWMRFGNVEVERMQNNKRQRFDTGFNDLTEPFIRLTIKEKKENDFITIDRPQSFLNEARLTGIALSIRFALLVGNNRPLVDGRVLALDDLLISLDMSNRERVIDVIFEEFLFKNKFMIYIFSHEKAFFNLVKRRIQRQSMEDDWQFIDIYERINNDIPRPFLIKSDSALSRAKEHFSNNDYPAAVVYQRKYLEGWFTNFIPSLNRRFKKNAQEIKLFNGLLVKAEQYFSEIGFNADPLTKLNIHREFLLNPLTHHENALSEVYKSDLQNVFDVIDYLEDVKNEPIIEVNNFMYVKISTQEGGQYEFELQLTNDFRLFKDYNIQSIPQDKISCICTSVIELHKDPNKKLPNNYMYRNKTLEEIYNGLTEGIKKVNGESPISEKEFIDIFYDSKGENLKHIIDKMY